MGDHEATRAQISCCTTTQIQVRCACRPIFSARCSATRALARSHSHTLRSRVLIRQPGNTPRARLAQIYSSPEQPHSSALGGKWHVRHLGNMREYRCGCPGLEERTGGQQAVQREVRFYTRPGFELQMRSDRPTIVSPHCHPAATGGSADSHVFSVIFSPLF